ncbi:hypothetical protein ACVIWU_006484 [Bradyrhizobium sp. USDA 4509]
MLESLRNSKIEWAVTRHEQTAAFMAATYGGFFTVRPRMWIAQFAVLGRSTSRPRPPYPDLGAIPLVMTTGQMAIMSGWEERFQLVDVIASTKPLAKRLREIVSSAIIPRWFAMRFVSPRGRAMRTYFGDEEAANSQGPSQDPMLNIIEQLERRRTPIAARSKRDGSIFDTFDIHLHGDRETEFFYV